MPGQFGPADQGGGPGSIWRIEGASGKITLFANLIYNGIENTPAALGGLAFDPVTQQLFVADRTTGMIHRFTLVGTDKGVFDHGVQGSIERPAAYGRIVCGQGEAERKNRLLLVRTKSIKSKLTSFEFFSKSRPKKFVFNAILISTGPIVPRKILSGFCARLSHNCCKRATLSTGTTLKNEALK